MSSILSAIGAAADVIGSGLQTGYNIYNAERNYRNQQEQQQYERTMQQKTMDREDTAVQRRTADLRAAGINPILAAGQLAQASAPIKVTTPIHSDIQLPSILNLMQMKNNIAQSQQQIEMNKSLIEKNEQEAIGTAVDTAIKIRDNKILAEKNQLSTGSGDETSGLINSAFPGLGSTGKARVQLLFKMLGGGATAVGKVKK